MAEAEHRPMCMTNGALQIHHALPCQTFNNWQTLALKAGSSEEGLSGHVTNDIAFECACMRLDEIGVCGRCVAKWLWP